MRSLSWLNVHAGSKILFDGDEQVLNGQELVATVSTRASNLADRGVRGDVVALSLPSNADMALDVLGAMAVGTAAPLNPAATEKEAKAYLEDLCPRLIVTSESSPAAKAAESLGIMILNPAHLAEKRRSVESMVCTTPDLASTALLLPTSGTTSRPKLVPLTHANLIGSARNIAASLHLSSEDRCLGLMPYFHIHGLVAGLMAPIVSGGSVVAAGAFDPARIRVWLERYGPTWYTAVPTMHRAVLDSISRDGVLQHKLRFVRSSSSPLAPALMNELEETLGVPAIEAYGMTEASHQLATNQLPPRARKAGTVGLPSGTDIAILTDGRVHNDPERTGEVVARGPNVTAGYHGDSEVNAAAFHDGWLRTGDLGCFDTDGYLRLVGRSKEMINRGGEKIAPREIDDVLLGHPSVSQAVAFSCPHPTLGEDVAAVVVLRAGEEATAAELIEFSAAWLASHKVPRQVIIADRIPVGPTGKPQRNAMAEQLGMGEGLAGKPPESRLSVVEAIWAEFLRLDRVPEDADFFALGGDSLSALALISAVEERLGRVVPLNFFRDGPATVGRMEELVAEPSSAVEPDPSTSGGSTMISAAERGVLVRSMLDPDGALHNEPFALRLHGAFDIQRLRTALQRVVAANEGLRTCFPTVGGRTERSVVSSLVVPIELRTVDPAEDLVALLRSEVRRPFDLERGPLVRVTVVPLSEHDHVLMLTVHHSVIDGLAKDLVLAEIGTAYREPLTPLPATDSLAAVAARQTVNLAAGKLDPQRSYWLEHLMPLPEPLEFRFQGPDGARRGFTGDVIGMELDAATSSTLRGLAHSCRTTSFVVFLAGVAATLSRLFGVDEIVVGTPTANRHRRGDSKVVGLLANMVALRINLVGDPTFEELVGRVRQITLGALANQEYPYERLIRDIHPESNFALDGLFGVICQFRRSPPLPDFGEDIAVSRMVVHNGAAKIDLSFDMREDDWGVTGTVEFNPDALDRGQVEDLSRRLSRLLAAAVACPTRNLSRLPLLDPDEVRQVVARGRGPDPVPPARSVVEIVIDQARRTPQAPAVIATDGTMSYGELDVKTSRVASALASRGIGPGDSVALLLGRDRSAIPALIGVLRAGATYVPLDPTHPATRLQSIVAASPLRLLVYAGAAPTWLAPDVDVVNYKELLGAAPEPSEPPIGPGPEDPAYILFTSGSTGTPKGVVIPHSAIVNMLSWVLRTFSRQELDRVLVGTSLTFDFSVLQIFAPLAVGGCAVLPDNVLALRDLNTSITLLGTSPSVLGALLDERAIPRHVGTIMSGGEALSKEMATRLLALEQRPRLVNIYGPTETTVLCSASEVSNVETIPPIGKPIDGALTLVMDRLGQPLPAGTSGELWVGGRGVSRGYLNDAALTAERFVEAEISSLGLQRMYRTGDRVWADEQGSLHFVRRLDNQLKLRGIRVEPGDVEAALLAHPDVTAAAVYVVGDEAARELHAAVVSRNGPVDAEELQSFAKRRLPRHMVPKRIHHLERLPVNQNGKVDRSALSATSAEIQRCRPPDSLESFQNLESLESLLLSTWERLLKTRGLEPESDFFDSGGDSLLVLAMLTEVERVVGCRLPLDWCFSGPITVHRLAMKVQEVLDAGSVGAHDEARSAHVIPLRVTGGKPPLFVIFADAAMALSARALAEALHADRPVYALAPIWTNVASRSELARRIASVITELSPWMAHLAGHSVGGLLAYETAGLLDDSGHTVGTTILVDTVTPGAARLSYRRQPLRRRVRVALRLPAFWRAAFWRAAAPAIGDYRFPFDRTPELFWKDDPAPIRRHVDLLITPTSAERYGALLGWADVHKGELTPRTVPGDHIGVLRSPNVEQLARTLDLCLDAVDSAPLNAER